VVEEDKNTLQGITQPGWQQKKRWLALASHAESCTTGLCLRGTDWQFCHNNALHAHSIHMIFCDFASIMYRPQRSTMGKADERFKNFVFCVSVRWCDHLACDLHVR